MRKLAILIPLAGLLACNPIRGTIKVLEPIQVLVTKTVAAEDPFCDPDDYDEADCEETEVEVKETINPGSYKAELEFQSKRKMTLNIKTDSRTDNKIPIKIPANVTIPQYEGEFSLTAAEIGQNYDIAGVVHTEHSRSGITSTTESCTYTEYKRVCRRVNADRGRRGRDGRRGRGRDGRGRRHCERKAVTRYGYRDVEYHHEYETKIVDLQMLSASRVVADFSGSLTDSDKVYDYRGRCF